MTTEATIAGLQFVPLSISLFLCLFLAVLGNVWVGDALKTWYPTLIKPRLLVPLWAFVAVGIAVYLIEGIVCYRLLVYVTESQNQIVAITALLVLMIYNEAWNYVFFSMRNLQAALVGIVGYCAPLAVLMATLFTYERVSGWIMLPYCLWVVYDVCWVYLLGQLNSEQSAG